MPDAPIADPAALELPLARNRDFRLLTGSQAISAVGDMVSITALPLLVLALTGSGVAMGTVFAIGAVSDFAVALYAGALADRTDRKRMMVVADIGRAVLTALIPLSVALGGPTMAVVLLVAAPMSLLRSFFRAGYIASVPTIVGRQHLARANGILETVSSTTSVLGPLIAGFLIAAIGAGLTLALDALSFAISAVGLFLMSATIRAPSGGAPTRIVDDIREGVSFVAHDRVLRVLIAYFALFAMLVAPLIVALAVRLTLDLGASPGAYGAVIACVRRRDDRRRAAGGSPRAPDECPGRVLRGRRRRRSRIDRDRRERQHPADPGPLGDLRRRRIGRHDRLHHRPGGAVPGRPPRPGRIHGADGVAGARTHRLRRRWRAHRRGRRDRDDRDRGCRDVCPGDRVHAGPRASCGVRPASPVGVASGSWTRLRSGS
jgi:MFS family permease